MTPGAATAAGSTRISENLPNHSSAGPARTEPDPPDVLEWKFLLTNIVAQLSKLQAREDLFKKLGKVPEATSEHLKGRQKQIDLEREALKTLKKVYEDNIQHVYDMRRIDRIFAGTYEVETTDVGGK